ncbi:MAG TPA: hypothetical protein VHR45_09960 [Thermoanaerobaculia bacterium]|nr:hypothetical protein [Thermoanaerobaculia bacterium]
MSGGRDEQVGVGLRDPAATEIRLQVAEAFGNEPIDGGERDSVQHALDPGEILGDTAGARGSEA